MSTEVEEAVSIQQHMRRLHAQLLDELLGMARVAVGIYLAPATMLEAFLKAGAASACNPYAVKAATGPEVAQSALAGLERIIADLAEVARMAHYARLIAAIIAGRCGFSRAFVEAIALFAPLHDIGKIAVPDDILLKPGRLTAGEYEIIKQHVAEGGRIIDGITGRLGVGEAEQIALLRNIVCYHHEWYDGHGYLAGLSGESIPIEARIVSVADVFDALTTQRLYKRAYSNREAISFINGRAGRQFDPTCVAALTARMAEVEAIQRAVRATVRSA